jgi:hypothetical protein
MKKLNGLNENGSVWKPRSKPENTVAGKNPKGENAGCGSRATTNPPSATQSCR